MSRTGILISSSALILLGTAAFTSAQDASNPATNRGAQSLEDSAKVFLNEKRRAQEAQRTKLEEAGIRFGQYRSLVARLTNISRRANRGLPGAIEGQVQEALIEDIALELATLGFGPQDLRPGVQSTELVTAASRKIRLEADYADYKLLSDLVIAGPVVGYRLPTQGQGGRSYLEIEVDTVIKGSAEIGTTVLVQLQSGMTSDGRKVHYSGEYLPVPGTRIVSLLSDIPQSLRHDDGRLRTGTALRSYTKMVEPLTISDGIAKSFTNNMPDVPSTDL